MAVHAVAWAGLVADELIAPPDQREVLAVVSTVVSARGQLLSVLERGREGALTSLGDALWWSANLGLAGTTVEEPVTPTGRLPAIALSVYALVISASLAGTIGAYFLEARRGRHRRRLRRPRRRAHRRHPPPIPHRRYPTADAPPPIPQRRPPTGAGVRRLEANPIAFAFRGDVP